MGIALLVVADVIRSHPDKIGFPEHVGDTQRIRDGQHIRLHGTDGYIEIRMTAKGGASSVAELCVER